MSVTSGWGRLTWDQSQWGGSTILSLGWGARSWNDGEWGELNDVTVSLTGQEITSSMGIEGWGNNTYGQGSWGEFAITIGLSPNFDISGVEFSASAGSLSGIGSAVVEQTGISASFNVGSLSVEADANVSTSGVSASFSIGSVTVADMAVGLTGQEATLSQGTAIAPNDTVQPSGVSFTASQG